MKETGHCPPVCPEIVSPIMREYAETPNAGKTLRKKKIKLISIVIVIGAVLLLFLLLQKSEFSLDDMQLSQDFQLILTCLIFSISGYQLPDFITALTSVIKTGEQEEAFSGFYLILFPCSLFFSFALAASLFQLI